MTNHIRRKEKGEKRKPKERREDACELDAHESKGRRKERARRATGIKEGSCTWGDMPGPAKSDAKKWTARIRPF